MLEKKLCDPLLVVGIDWMDSDGWHSKVPVHSAFKLFLDHVRAGMDAGLS